MVVHALARVTHCEPELLLARFLEEIDDGVAALVVHPAARRQEELAHSEPREPLLEVAAPLRRGGGGPKGAVAVAAQPGALGEEPGGLLQHALALGGETGEAFELRQPVGDVSQGHFLSILRKKALSRAVQGRSYSPFQRASATP